MRYALDLTNKRERERGGDDDEDDCDERKKHAYYRVRGNDNDEEDCDEEIVQDCVQQKYEQKLHVPRKKTQGGGGET